MAGASTGSEARASVWRRLAAAFDPALLMLLVGPPLMIACAWAVALTQSGLERERAAAHALSMAEGLAHAFDEQSQRTIGAADQMLRLVRQHYADDGAAIDIADVLKDAAYIGPAYLRVRIADAQGRPVASSVDDGPASMRERDYFLAQRGSDADALFIGMPADYDGERHWTIQLSRRIVRADGTFGGIVMASLEPSYFLHGFRDADLGPRDLALLAGRDGSVRVRLQGRTLLPGGTNAFAPVFRQASGLPGTRSTEDGVHRYWAVHAVEGYPLAVAIGLHAGDALDAAERNCRSYLLAAGAFTACVLLLTWLSAWLSLRQRRILKALAASEREANALKSDFIANISHDLRTPLNGIIGFADLLQATASEPQQREYAGYILDSGRHLLALVNMILDLSKMRAGKLQLQRSATDLRELARQVSHTQAMAAQAKGLEYVLHVADDFPVSVDCDGVRMREVLNNLLHNAIKFTEQGRVTLELAHAGGQVLIRTVDTGVGISAEEQQRLFQFFAEGRDAAVRNNVGSGLGLAFSQELVKLHGGRITVVSAPGKGTTVTVLLPQHRQGE